MVIVDGTDDAEIESIIGSSSYELFTVITSDALIQSDPGWCRKRSTPWPRPCSGWKPLSRRTSPRSSSPFFEGAEEELLYDAQYDQGSGRSPASPATTPNLVLRPPYP